MTGAVKNVGKPFKRADIRNGLKVWKEAKEP
jgi:hypothetical protein